MNITRKNNGGKIRRIFNRNVCKSENFGDLKAERYIAISAANIPPTIQPIIILSIFNFFLNFE